MALRRLDGGEEVCVVVEVGAEAEVGVGVGVEAEAEAEVEVGGRRGESSSVVLGGECSGDIGGVRYTTSNTTDQMFDDLRRPPVPLPPPPRPPRKD